MKDFCKVLFCLAAGVILLAAAVFLMPEKSIDPIDELPDHDYIAEIRALIAAKKYGEAKVLAEDVIKLELPGRSTAEILKSEAEREAGKLHNRIWKSGRAFITGDPDGSVEEIGGSIVSDMLMYGDLRDLVKQGWFKITGRETDPVIIALAGAGLATEFVDAADWVPAVLKAFRKFGSMTGEIAGFIVKSCEQTIRNGKVSDAGKLFFRNSKSLVKSAGFIRAKNIFSIVRKPDELALLSKAAAGDPHITHLVVRHAGESSGEILQKSSGKLRQIARKGKMAVRLLKSAHKHYRYIPELSREAKYFICAVMAAVGAWFILLGVLKIIRSRKNAAVI